MLHNKKWKIEENQIINIEKPIHPVVKQLLVNRGYNTEVTVEKFLNPSIHDLYDPLKMDGMEEAVKRIQWAIFNKEPIWIYGDYDVDGITSIALLVKAFSFMNVPVHYYIPNRLEEGYGLSEFGLEKVIEQGAEVIISVDCGITSIAEALFVKSKGKDLIITDHHNPQESLPDAYTVINPKKEECEYPFDMLAGVGIALKLAQALLKDDFYEHKESLLEIAALGTVADIAPIVDENRIITKLGLKAMLVTQNPGLKALLEVSGLDGDLNTGHIGFNLGPKINAAGRIGQPELGVKLLIENSYDKALNIARQLASLNEERQNIEKDILKEIDGLIEQQVDLKHEKIIVVCGENWHTGVIGIVASRVTELYHRPSVVLSLEDGKAKGSARSVGSISIFDALNSCKDLFIGFGGHKQAAGLSLEANKVSEFREKVNDYARDMISKEDLVPLIRVDGILHSQDITYQALDDLELLEPFGLGNPKPNFVYNGLTVDSIRKIGQEKNHIKMILHDDKRTFDAIAFRAADLYGDLRSQDKLDMVIGLSKNSFRGVDTIQFMIKDVRRLEASYYENSEIGKLFTKTLGRALFYNGICGPKGPSSTFIEYERGFANRLDYCTKSGGKRLILVNSFTNFIELYYRIDDLGYSKEEVGIHFNTVSEPKGIDILVHPILNKIDDQYYHEIVVYDFMYSLNWKNVLESFAKKPVRYMVQPWIDEKVQTEVLYTAVPHRMDLVDIYKSLLSEEGSLAITLEDFSKLLHMNVIKCELSLRILANLKLIKLEGDETYHISVLPRPAQKLELDQTAIFKKISSLRDDFFEYIKYYKEVIK